MYSFQNNITDQSFKIFFKSNFQSLYYFIKNYIPDSKQAEDITQETLIKIYLRWNDFEDELKAKSYAYVTAKNISFDYIRKLKVRDEYAKEAISFLESEEFFLTEITKQETLSILYAAINSLSGQTRKIILLGLKGNTNKEIAENLKISINTVKTLKKTAYKKIKALLAEEYHYLIAIFSFLLK